MTRRIALVSGHFPPSNLVGAQRARLWSRYLPEFGWDPIVVTGDPAEYEERPDPDLERLLAPGLRVVHAKTLPTRPVRLVGDIGIRSFWGCYRVLARMAEAREIDFVMVTIPSNFLAPVGRLVHLRQGRLAVRRRQPERQPLGDHLRVEIADRVVAQLGRSRDPVAGQGQGAFDFQARLDLAMAYWAGNQKQEAVDELLAMIKADRNWNEAAARQQLLKFFEALGFTDPISVDGRKRLSTILFS